MSLPHGERKQGKGTGGKEKEERLHVPFVAKAEAVEVRKKPPDEETTDNTELTFFKDGITWS